MCEGGAPTPPAHDLVATADAIDEMVVRAREAWPEIALDRDRFARHVAGRLVADVEIAEQLGELHVEDLALAFACAQGDVGALREFERLYGPPLRRWVMRLAGDAVRADEVVQAVRDRMLGGTTDAKIASFAGRGSLLRWLRVAARRAGVDYLRSRGHEPISLDDAALDDRIGASDPEMAFIKDAYRETFSDAFRRALAGLATRQRNILRQRFVNGLRSEELASMYRVDRRTINRWIASARRAVLEGVHADLSARLELSRDELASMVRLVRSRLELSLATVLGGGPT